MNDVVFTRGQGGLGRPLPNNDHISALCMPCLGVQLPAGFNASRIQKTSSKNEAEALGLVMTSAHDAVKKATYQMLEFYRMHPKGVLYINLFTPGDDFKDTIRATVDFPTNGEIRQLSIMSEVEVNEEVEDVMTIIGANLIAAVADAQTVATECETTHKPLSIFVGSDKWGVVNINGLPDLRATNKPNVTWIAATDGNFTSFGGNFVQPALGAWLGAVSFAKVHESIAWVEKFNFSDGTNLEKLGILIALTPADDNVDYEALEQKGYGVLKKHIGIAGSYAYDSTNCAIITSDYAKIENERTMDKACRNIRTATLPNLAAPLYVDAETGFLRQDTVDFFKEVASGPLNAMLRDGEISGFAVIINPEQPILTTSVLEITVEIVPVGVARRIQFKIGFTVKLSQ